MYYRTLTVCLQPYIPAWLIIPCISMHYLFAHQCSNILTCRIVESSCFLYLNWVTLLRTLPHVGMKRKDVFEAKIEESEKAGSHRESNPGHLWLVQPVLCHWATTTRQPPALTTLFILFWYMYIYRFRIPVHVWVMLCSNCLNTSVCCLQRSTW